MIVADDAMRPLKSLLETPRVVKPAAWRDAVAYAGQRM